MKTLLFDMDGTLIDTERFYRIAWPRAMADFGYTMTDAQALEMRSLGRPFVFDHFKSLYGTCDFYSQVRKRRNEIMQDLMKEYGRLCKPRVPEALKLLKEKDFRLAVVTASDIQRAEKYLGETGIIDYFDEIVCATMVSLGKPAPDVYLLACQTLGLDPAYATAIEDSPNGIISAHKAGCRTVMIPDQDQPSGDILSMIDEIYPTLIEFAKACQA